MNAYLAEFLGTAILILFGGGVCANVNLKKVLVTVQIGLLLHLVGVWQ